MKTLILLGLVILAVCDHHHNYITRDHIEQVRKVATFETYDYEEHPFKDATESDLLATLGLKGLSFEGLPPLPKGDLQDIPESFNSRDKWPQCIHQIRDQQKCGSCWAFAASEVLSDRFCIASNGKVDHVLSPQDMVSCDTQDHGCHGGNLHKSWYYLTTTGIVDDECYPYTSGKGDSGKCTVTNGKCIDGKTDAIKYKSHKVQQFTSVAAIKSNIIANGPVETGFIVYDDFISYKGGIYKKSSNRKLGGHAVKVIGWGTENGTDYWIVANSWGTKWGESGHFRIAINNCCNFDNQMIAGEAFIKNLA
jgi:cathepsin B